MGIPFQVLDILCLTQYPAIVPGKATKDDSVSCTLATSVGSSLTTCIWFGLYPALAITAIWGSESADGRSVRLSFWLYISLCCRANQKLNDPFKRIHIYMRRDHDTSWDAILHPTSEWLVLSPCSTLIPASLMHLGGQQEKVQVLRLLPIAWHIWMQLLLLALALPVVDIWRVNQQVQDRCLCIPSSLSPCLSNLILSLSLSSPSTPPYMAECRYPTGYIGFLSMKKPWLFFFSTSGNVCQSWGRGEAYRVWEYWVQIFDLPHFSFCLFATARSPAFRFPGCRTESKLGVVELVIL